MNIFDVKKFEKNKRKQGYNYEYRYKLADGSDVKECKDTTNKPTIYQREITKEHSPFQTIYTYFDNGLLHSALYNFNDDSCVLYTEYSTLGTVTKERNYDKEYQHNFEQIRNVVLKEKKIDIYDKRQAYALRKDTPNRHYEIHVLKSELVNGQWHFHPSYSLTVDDATGEVWSSNANSVDNNTNADHLDLEPNDHLEPNHPDKKAVASSVLLDDVSSNSDSDVWENKSYSGIDANNDQTRFMPPSTDLRRKQQSTIAVLPPVKIIHGTPQSSRALTRRKLNELNSLVLADSFLEDENDKAIAARRPIYIIVLIVIILLIVGEIIYFFVSSINYI